MRRAKKVLIGFTILSIIVGIFLYKNWDNFVYLGDIEIVDVDCAKQAEILDKVYESDQRIRKEEIPFSQFGKEDRANQELVLGILEKCGMPTLNEVNQKQMDAIWLALQHTDKKYRKKYFPKIEKAVENGDLSKSSYALMKDRILMDEGKPQIYGSQIKNGKLYKLESPEGVNERRAEMGLQPIEQYLLQFNIKYERS